MTSLSLWAEIFRDAEAAAKKEPAMAAFIQAMVLDHDSFAQALAFQLATEFGQPRMPADTLNKTFCEIYADNANVWTAGEADIRATRARDAACNDYLAPLLFFKGYRALQGYRVAHWLWTHGHKVTALYLQSMISARLNADIHPAARIGEGVTLDHATGLVVGETCVIENEVSLFQDVTLGGTGKEGGDRHPKVRHGVLISSGAKILGNIEIGESAKVGAGSVVLKDVPAHTTVAGVPAVVVGASLDTPALTMDHTLEAD